MRILLEIFQRSRIAALQKRTSAKGSCRPTVLRRITTFVVLAAFAGIYALPLAAAIFPLGISDCCAHGMCPRMKQSAKTATEDDSMPDCAMNDQKSHAQTSCTCTASSCDTHTGNAIGIGYYVLPVPAKMVYAASVSTLISTHSQFSRPLSSVPEAPPPRN